MPMDENEQKAFDQMKADAEAAKAEVTKLKADSDAEKAKREKEAADKDKNKDEDLLTKAKKEKDDAEKAKGDSKKIEGAIGFNMGIENFVKEHKDLLPSDFDGVLKAASKETYDSQSEKAAALKCALVQSFFSVQSNLDLLTTNQKNQVADFLKLTKTGKEGKASELFENVFEPALETLKKVKKAEELGKSRQGLGSSSAIEDGYKNRLMAGSRKAYLNEKDKGA